MVVERPEGDRREDKEKIRHDFKQTTWGIEG